jgi:acyl-[acyl-carrier-protein]-phospholipid O-acyltransferase/long-chain-fatty-acid--[acyl-carrier-protein] ligase
MVAGWVAIGVAAAGYVAARAIPAAPAEPGNRIDWHPWRAARTALGQAFGNTQVRIATIAISWFWALGAVYTSQFVPLAKNDLGGDEGVATLFLAAFSVGVALGSAVVSRLLGHRVSARLAVPAGIVMALAGLDLFLAERAFGGAAGDVRSFLADPRGWRVLADLTVLAVAGGIFSVPLYGILQTATAAGGRARAIAANNIVNSAFQVAAVLGIGVAINRGSGIPAVLLAAGLTVVLLIPMLRRLPR